MRRLLLPTSLAVGALSASLSAADPRPVTFDDLLAFHRISDPQPSPDGRWLAYVVTDVDKAENRSNSDIWILPVEGGTPRQLTRSPKHDRHPRWSPDGRFLVFESNRDGAFQAYVLPLAGGEARALTTLSSEANQPVWSPDGSHVAFVSAVFPEFSSLPFAESDRKNREQQESRDKSKVKARVIDQLLYRHWDSWVDGKRQHLFVIPVADGAPAGSPRDLTPGDRDAVPTSSTFSAGDEFAFSPDGGEIVHTATPTPTREEAWSTNHDLYAVRLSDGRRRQITSAPAAEGLPRFSPDGRWLAYRAQARAGFEADRWQLFLLDRQSGQTRSLTSGFDTSVEGITWAGNDTLVLEAEDQGTKRLYRVPLAGGTPQPLTTGGSAGEAEFIRGRNELVFSRAAFQHPARLERVAVGGGEAQVLSPENQALLATLKLPQPRSVTVKGAGGAPVQMWILPPPGFDETKKSPLVFWVHGGPQGAWMDGWSYRWNAQLWAAQGYVLAMPNPRGSTGFGQKFTDEISRDWGGKVFEDLMAGAAWLEQQPWVDTNRMAAAGASYGGYMMNWFQGHTDRFKTLVTHCGVYDFSTMYGTTEELWFDEWEHGLPWENPEFDQWSPHRFAGKFKTPNLIIHNELDFRVPIHQGLSLFTTLQRKGVPSRLLYFPDEGHWVNKPQNSELWHRTIFDWLAGYLKPAAGSPPPTQP
jgi:dipeptidyl aminopeptidase/acylaminoacyl peptidase